MSAAAISIGVAAGSLAILLLWPRLSRKVPAPIVAITAITVAVALFGVPVETIGSRFGEIAATVPQDVEVAWQELQLAQQNAEHASPVERDLIEALSHRYANPQPTDRVPLDQALEALDKDVIGRTPEDFYYLSRATLVKDERNLDKFDQVFGHVFKGLEGIDASLLPKIAARGVTVSTVGLVPAIDKLTAEGLPVTLAVFLASVVGFMLIAFLFVVGLTNDIDRLRGEGFNVR